MIRKHDVVQFNERHPYCGCIGIVAKVEVGKKDVRYTVGIPIPQQDTFYVQTLKSAKMIEKIGRAGIIFDSNYVENRKVNTEERNLPTEEANTEPAEEQKDTVQADDIEVITKEAEIDSEESVSRETEQREGSEQ